MEFSIKEKKSLIRIQRNSYVIEREVLCYKNNQFPIFAICKINIDNIDFGFPTKNNLAWGLQHIPSERIVISLFKKKSEAEKFFDYLIREYDLNSLLLFNPKFESLEEDFIKAVEKAYIKYYKGAILA